ncbi:MAG: DUF4430 domain-containing protein [Lachnospiraceae bacterium]|nr:DUF4430 domain-containing protein [Lachnospiraceae bacterium]
MKKGDWKKALIPVCILLLAVAIFAIAFVKFGEAPVEGEKRYTLTVVDDAGAVKDYEGLTKAKYLRELLDELQEKGDFSYSGVEESYGLYITTVNGLAADNGSDHAYWAIYVNNEYGQYGADSQPVKDGDEFRLEYSKTG